MPQERRPQIIFHPFRLDVANQQLWREGQTVALSLKAFALLELLIERRGQLVTKEELLEAVWPDTFVTDIVLKVRIAELRKALGDEARTPRFIETAQRRGYRFIAKIETARRDHSVAAVGPIDSPQLVVGRRAELASLSTHLDEALTGHRQILFISGEPGIGKTTLVSTFLREVEPNLIVARGQCLEQFGGSEAYLPWLDAFSHLARAREDCITLLRRHAPMWLAQMPWLLDETERATLQNEIAGATRARMLREMAQLIEALTVQTPMVLALEDLHWSDYSTLDLIGYLARRTEPARLLLIGTYRPVEVILSGHPLKAVKQELRTHHLCVELPLDFLSETAIADYLKLRFPAQQFPAELAALIHRRTDGNPLFMVSFLSELAPLGLVDKVSPMELKAAIEMIKVAAPANVRQLIEKQIERLSETDQEILEAASVAGLEFSSRLAAAALQIDTIEAERSCARLARNQQLLRATGERRLPNGRVTATYEFIHALYQNGLYERVTMTRRAVLHQRIGEFKESSYGERATEIASELALHFESGQDWERAAKYLLLAARQTNEVFAAREAVALAERGLKAIGKLPESQRVEQELSAQIVLGNALMATRGFAAAEVRETYERARDLCLQIGHTPYLLPVLYGLFANHLVRGKYGTALNLGREFLARAQQKSDPALVVGHRMMALPLLATGKFVEAREHLEEIALLYNPEQHRPLTYSYGQEPGLAGYAFLALTTWFLGYPELALRQHQKAIDIGRKISHPQSQAYGLTWAAMHYQCCRDVEATRLQADALIKIATEHGLMELWLAWGTILRGWASVEPGQYQDGIQQMRSGLKAMLSTGTRMFFGYYVCVLADGYLKAGQYNEGLQVLSDLAQSADVAEEQFSHAEAARLKGELLLLAGGDSAEVEACFQRSIDLSREQQAKSLELRATMSLSRLWQRTGRHTEARAHLNKVYAWFTEGFDSPDLRAAETLLQELD
jgi:DNA-binding winged helix-turn-helix (wHTH) protein/predicted ATPase